MSMQMPIDYIGIVRGFGNGHRGIDFGWNAKYGGPRHPILAADDGTVAVAYLNPRNNYAEYSQGLEPAIYGTYIQLQHADGLQTVYGHLEYGTVLVRAGDTVRKGQRIATMGNTGSSSGTHLHFEVRQGGQRVNGLDYVLVQPGQVVSENSNLKDQIRYAQPALPVIGTPVVRDGTKNQIEVAIDNLRVRSGPYRMDNVLGYLKPGWYDVLETSDMRAEESNGYLWYCVQAGYWCAQVTGVTYYPASGSPEPAPQPDDREDWLKVYTIAKAHVETEPE